MQRSRVELTLLICLTFCCLHLAIAAPEDMVPVYDYFVDSDIMETFTYFETEISTLGNQLTDLDKSLDALKQLALEKYNWSDTKNLIDQLGETMSQENALSYNIKNEDQQFQKLFPGYAASTNYSAQYEQITNTSLNTLNNILQTVGLSAADFADENSRLAFLQQQTQNVEGQTQALQMASQIASEEVAQLQLLRQTVSAQANAQVVYYASQIQQSASAQAELKDMITAGDTHTTGKLDDHPLSNIYFSAEGN